jgi:3-oxoacyl-[acyl-carrier protein] reductase
MNELNEKIALVSGASRGIGAAIALTLAKKGAYVIGTATSESSASNITEFLKQERCAGEGVI